MSNNTYAPSNPEAFTVQFGNDPESFMSKLVASRPFIEGERIGSLGVSHPSSAPVYSTVQVGREAHIELDSDLRYTNHSCQPSTLFDTVTMEVRAARDIEAGEELTYFYPSTEWKVTQVFPCWCGSEQCIGDVQGASYLSPKALEGHYVNPHITALVQEGSKKE
ncbi:hypothetical protein BJ684DRAFT_12493 [Piptocephalis cylindrospora]|uniref:SET domain-containing protein n=1 Tax=Piptocephalis cylindrospora TaxID=1907219 RepID=A0A4P9XZC4_9FUNG|nr:hypothetical protein BJ684DRAFT_12493 [Piptocephalis cylindrospora]|eukprot:RKP11757.1 hypothetical protein BJ684DRAFT_12493 [Piptocephalis cylindrospora]